MPSDSERARLNGLRRNLIRVLALGSSTRTVAGQALALSLVVGFNFASAYAQTNAAPALFDVHALLLSPRSPAVHTVAPVAPKLTLNVVPPTVVVAPATNAVATDTDGVGLGFPTVLLVMCRGFRFRPPWTGRLGVWRTRWPCVR